MQGQGSREPWFPVCPRGSLSQPHPSPCRGSRERSVGVWHREPVGPRQSSFLPPVSRGPQPEDLLPPLGSLGSWVTPTSTLRRWKELPPPRSPDAPPPLAHAPGPPGTPVPARSWVCEGPEPPPHVLSVFQGPVFLPLPARVPLPPRQGRLGPGRRDSLWSLGCAGGRGQDCGVRREGSKGKQRR